MPYALCCLLYPVVRYLPYPVLRHARVVEGVKPFKTVDIHDLPKAIFLSGQPCLEGSMTFGDPFEDSGVACADSIP